MMTNNNYHFDFGEIVSCSLQLLAIMSMGMRAAGAIDSDACDEVLRKVVSIIGDDSRPSNEVLSSIISWCENYRCPYCGYSKDDRMEAVFSSAGRRVYSQPKVDEFIGVSFVQMIESLRKASNTTDEKRSFFKSRRKKC